ncbi:MAG: tRNA (adenosine(37)-N6)-threonylcarbamoyltransferase complex ATPase subunit type 1 TsaE [Candidatus Paceibacterota bacterium]
MKFISKSLKDTQKIAGEVLVKLSACAKSDLATRDTTSHKLKAAVLLLQGDLGSGKTTFTQALARELGVKENLTSPTFVLMKSYVTRARRSESRRRPEASAKWANLIHIDAYRLNQGEDLKNLGWDEISSNPNNLIVVEWPEKVSSLWTGEETKLNFKFIDDQTREISD